MTVIVLTHDDWWAYVPPINTPRAQTLHSLVSAERHSDNTCDSPERLLSPATWSEVVLHYWWWNFIQPEPVWNLFPEAGNRCAFTRTHTKSWLIHKLKFSWPYKLMSYFFLLCCTLYSVSFDMRAKSWVKCSISYCVCFYCPSKWTQKICLLKEQIFQQNEWPFHGRVLLTRQSNWHTASTFPLGPAITEFIIGTTLPEENVCGSKVGKWEEKMLKNRCRHKKYST